MKDILKNLHKAFDNRTRLGIMSILMVEASIDFKRFKELLDETDGNLATHLSQLEKSEFIAVKKQFVGKRPNTSYSATEAGKKAFNDHLDALESILHHRG